MGFLEITRADLRRRDVGGNHQHRHARPVAVEQPVDKVEIARSAASGAHGQRSSEMRLGASREGRHLLVAHMQPLDLASPPDRIGDADQAVADDAIDALDAGRGQDVGELIGNRSHDDSPLLSFVTGTDQAARPPSIR